MSVEVQSIRRIFENLSDSERQHIHKARQKCIFWLHAVTPKCDGAIALTSAGRSAQGLGRVWHSPQSLCLHLGAVHRPCLFASWPISEAFLIWTGICSPGSPTRLSTNLFHICRFQGGFFDDLAGGTLLPSGFEGPH